MEKIIFNARLEASCFKSGQILREDKNIPEIAIAGRSNVGKSSLINAILDKKLAHTGSTPGKTRSINFYLVEEKSKNILFRLVDFPGYGYASRSKTERNEWLKLISDYISNRESLKIVCHLVDFRHGLLANDRELQEWLNDNYKKIFVIFTKADKIPKGKWRVNVQNYVKEGLFSVDVPIVTSAEKKVGIEEVKKFLVDFI